MPPATWVRGGSFDPKLMAAAKIDQKRARPDEQGERPPNDGFDTLARWGPNGCSLIDHHPMI